MIYNSTLADLARDHRNPNYLRVVLFCMAHLPYNTPDRVLHFDTGELAGYLMCPSRKRPGDSVPMAQQALSRAIKQAVDLGFLAEGSKPRRIEIAEGVMKARFD